ncbi:MAG: Abi family protein [Streptococcus parauberis]
MSKPFKTFEEQIEILKSRNLNFINENAAKDILSTYSYYEIINGYKEVGLESDDCFKEGVTFEQLYNLFLMDKKIRTLISISINELESQLRTAISYVVSKHYSSNQSLYLNRRNFEKGKVKYNISQRTQLLNKCRKIIEDDRHPYKHYREKHGNVPPWILVKGMTFGNLITFYKLQLPNIKDEVVSIMTGIPIELVDDELKEMIINIFYFLLAHRNNTAHVCRAYNFKTEKSKISYYSKFHERMRISKAEYDRGEGQDGLNTLAMALSWFKIYDYPTSNLTIGMLNAIKEYLKLYPLDREFIIEQIGGEIIPHV